MIQHIHKKTGEHTRFYILLTCLMVLLIARCGFQIGVPRIVLTATIALIALLSDQNELWAIAMCCIPLHEAVDFFYALVACAVAYVMQNHRKIRINLAACLVLLIITWELLHCFAPDFAAMSFLVNIVPLIFLTVLLCADVSEVKYGFLVRVMSFVVILTCVTVLMNIIVRADYNVIAALSGLRRLGLVNRDERRYMVLGSILNPNALGVICVLAATGLLQLRASGEHKKTDIIMVIFLVSFGALTSSRTFLICLLLMILLVILAQPGNTLGRLRFVIFAIMLLVASVMLLSSLVPDLLDYYISRFQEADITTGRNELMHIYHDYIKENISVMFFGVGCQNFAKKLTEVYRIAGNVPHNSIQEIIVAWGIPGLIMFILLLTTILRQARKYNQKPILLNYIPFVIILVKSMAGQLLTSGYTMLSLSYAYLSLCQNFQPNKET